MSTSKHTPGPWMADAEDMQLGADDIFTVSIWAPGPDGDRPHISTVSAFSLMSAEFVTTDAPSIDKLEEAKANARLIAAAPELLEALQSLTLALKSAGYGTAHADAAIAKATGG